MNLQHKEVNGNQVKRSLTHVQRKDGRGSKSRVGGNPTHAQKGDRKGMRIELGGP